MPSIKAIPSDTQPADSGPYEFEDADHSALDVAVIGLTGRFPRSNSAEALWRNLCDGVEGISFFSDEELLATRETRENLDNPNYVKAGGMLTDIDLFDAEFFACSPREAAMLDPQHRLFLECAWEALELAGYAPGSYRGRIGVFAGCAMSDYLPRACVKDIDPMLAALATEKDFLPTRVSYKLNLRGPSIAVQTACSTSLVAVHLAWQSLLAGSCDMALAGGASIRLLEPAGYWHWEGGISSPDGHCRAFDEQAAGTVFGDGVGIVVLKRLTDALRDRDTIRAVIRGSAINNDGSLKAGFTAPSVEGQASVISEAIAVAGISPETIGYVETHGTGTALGDPVEISALTQAFSASTSRKQFCAIGSVKTSVGHLNMAAGVTGLINAVLAVENGLLPPTLHFKRPNPNIGFESSPFYVNSSLTKWPGPRPRRASVSSFGIGGTNAHMILEEPPVTSGAKTVQAGYVLPFAARTPAALEKMPSRLAAHLRNRPDLDLADVAYTLQVGREAFDYRRVLVCGGREEALELLESAGPQLAFPSVQASQRKSVVFIFPGQGTQYPNMARDLYLTESAFRRDVDDCAQRLEKHLNRDIRALLYGGVDAHVIDETWITQPALFVIEYALAQQWMAWGVQPNAMIGHSIGELVAACLAGVFSLDEALALVAARGKLMQSLPAGSMLAVFEGEAKVRGLLPAGLSLAAVNTSSSCVISGPFDLMDAFAQKLAELGIDCRRLQTSHAFHSAMMDPILEQFTTEVRRVQLRPPKIAFISNVTGDWITPEMCMAPEYWANHLRRTVMFSAGIERLLQRTDQVLLEVGPGRALAGMIGQHQNGAPGNVVVSSLRDAAGPGNEYQTLLRAVGCTWAAGVKVDWPALHAGEQPRRVPLPPYPFERSRHWMVPSESAVAITAQAGANGQAVTKSSEVSRPVAASGEASVAHSQRDDNASSSAAPTSTAPIQEELVSGPVPLTPIQQWFFNQEFPQPHHWNIAALINVQPEVTTPILDEALRYLLRHHDALRLRFYRRGTECSQVNSTRQHEVLTTVALSEGDADLIQRRTAEAQATLNLAHGPLVRALQFSAGQGRPSPLVLIAHHLAVDITSYRIMVEDLETACAQLLRGSAIQLPRKTTSFKSWAERLAAHRSSTDVQTQMQQWLARCKNLKVPQIGPKRGQTKNTVDSRDVLTAFLSADETLELTRVTARKHGARCSEAVVAAVAECMGALSDGPIMMDVEMHGREPIFEELDLSRTVGWFTTLFPVIVNLGTANQPGSVLEDVKEQLRMATDGGIGYGILRYMNTPSGEPPLASMPRAQVSFNFLGQEDRASATGSLVQVQQMVMGSEYAPRNHRPYLIDVNSWISEGRLHVSFGYSRNLFRRGEMAKVSASCMSLLRAMIGGADGNLSSPAPAPAPSKLPDRKGL
ncbi:MAG TPA: beta-ketoacyl synthase N-terminal-like domain-containing protein [Candidatus Solibacter sp.]|nr:beta-ketoacyl synthase N-terminal-like domain-containing protein [Candidatus Solibacter sp.]